MDNNNYQYQAPSYQGSSSFNSDNYIPDYASSSGRDTLSSYASSGMNFYGEILVQKVFLILFDIGILFGNLMVMFAILLRPNLRRNSKYMIVFFLCLVDLFNGCFPIPISISMLNGDLPVLSCSTIKALQGFPLFHVMMSMLAIIALNLDFIGKTRGEQSSLTEMKQKRAAIAYISLCVGLPLIILMPILIQGRVSYGLCSTNLLLSYLKGAYAVSFWLPFFLVVGSCLLAIIVRSNANRRSPNTQPSSDVIVASVLTLIFFFPSEVVVTHCLTSPLNCSVNLILLTFLQYWFIAKSLVVPFVWLTDKSFRDEVGSIFTHRSPQATPPPPQGNQYGMGQVSYGYSVSVTNVNYGQNAPVASYPPQGTYPQNYPNAGYTVNTVQEKV